MDLYQYFGFLVILKESFILLYKNGKLMVLVTKFSIILSSIFFSIFNFSSFSLTRDMLVKESFFPISSSNSAEFARQLAGIQESLPRVLATYVLFVLSYFTVTFLSTIATIIVAGESYNDNTLSLKGLCSRMVKSWRRPFVTGFYTAILVIGYIYFVLFTETPLLMSSSMSRLGLAVLFGGIAYVIYLYLSSVWILGLVVSASDEGSCGIEALGKSAKIMKGQMLNGFLLNIVLNLVTFGVFLGSKMTQNVTISGLVLVNGSCLVRILTYLGYTVMYFQGKRSYDQESELNGKDVEYGKLSTIPLANGAP